VYWWVDSVINKSAKGCLLEVVGDETKKAEPEVPPER
jgi:hypothetical protein